jgi:hypothetical protein
VLDEEAGLAHELAGLLGQHPQRAVTSLVGITDVFVIFVGLVIVADDQTFLEDHIEAGLYVVGILVIFVFILFVVLAYFGFDGRVHIFGFPGIEVVIDDGVFVFVDDLFVFVLEVLEILFVEVLRHVSLVVEELVV